MTWTTLAPRNLRIEFSKSLVYWSRYVAQQAKYRGQFTIASWHASPYPIYPPAGAVWGVRAALILKHKDELSKESLESGKTYEPHEFHAEAQRRADDEHKRNQQEAEGAVEDLKQEAHESEKALIQHVAEAQGWDTEGLEITDEQWTAAADAATKEFLAQKPDSDSAKLEEKVKTAVARVEAVHHQRLLSPAREVLDNHKAIGLAAHDELARGALGDISIGDLVKDSLGDAGKGYQANLANEALERGIGGEHLKALAQENQYQNLLERKDGDVEAVGKAQEAIEKMHAGAARSRAAIDKAKAGLGASGCSGLSVLALAKVILRMGPAGWGAPGPATRKRKRASGPSQSAWPMAS